MAKDYSFQVHINIMRALKRSNDLLPDSNFSTLDGNILCMVRSFNESGYVFFMSDKELADINITSEKTIQRSIKRLCAAGLLTSRQDYTGGARRRYLEYSHTALQELLDLTV